MDKLLRLMDAREDEQDQAGNGRDLPELVLRQCIDQVIAETTHKKLRDTAVHDPPNYKTPNQNKPGFTYSLEGSMGFQGAGDERATVMSDWDRMLEQLKGESREMALKEVLEEDRPSELQLGYGPEYPNPGTVFKAPVDPMYPQDALVHGPEYPNPGTSFKTPVALMYIEPALVHGSVFQNPGKVREVPIDPQLPLVHGPGFQSPGTVPEAHMYPQSALSYGWGQQTSMEGLQEERWLEELPKEEIQMRILYLRSLL